MKEQQLQLVSFEQAKRLKEAGFDFHCEHRFTNGHKNLLNRWTDLKNANSDKFDISAPTVAIALKWFRDVKLIDCAIQIQNNEVEKVLYFGNYFSQQHKAFGFTQDYEIYEAAETALLDELLTLIEK